MIITLVVLGALLPLAVGGYLVARSRGSKEAAFHSFRCPACGQKVRFAAEKAGRAGMCPRCKECWRLPTHPSAALPAAATQQSAVGRRLVLRRT